MAGAGPAFISLFPPPPAGLEYPPNYLLLMGMCVRHLILTFDFPPRCDGGIAALMMAQADGFSRLGEEVGVVTRSGASDGRGNYPVFSLWGHRWLDFYRLWLRLQLPALLRRLRPQVVYAADWRLAEIPLQMRADLGFRVVVWTHGLDMFGTYSLAEQSRRQYSLCQADLVFATHTFGESCLVMMGTPLRKIRRVLPGLTRDFCETPGDGERFRHTWKLGDGPFVLSLSRLSPRKGHQQVLACLPELLPRLAGLRYVIAGKGPELNTLQMLTKSLGLTDHVVFTGFLDDQARADAYAGADVVISAGMNREAQGDLEGFCITNLEAAWWGRPVIATRVGGMVDSVLDGETGYLVDSPEELSQRLRMVLETPPLRLRLGEAARQWARHLGPPEVLGRRVLDTLP